MDIHARLAALDLTLPPAPQPVAAYVPGVRSGDLFFISGQLPLRRGELLAAGPVPSSVSLEMARGAARQCVLNALAIVDDGLGHDWSRLRQIVRLGVFVQSDANFHEQHLVADGASDLLRAIFAETGRHARAAVGVNALPLNASVEIDMVVQIADGSLQSGCAIGWHDGRVT